MKLSRSKKITKKMESDSKEVFVEFFATSRVLKSILGFAISFFCIYLLKNEMAALPEDLQFSMFSLSFLTLSVLFACIGQFSRALRWSKMINLAGGTTNNYEVLSAYFKSVLANNLLPLRAGDILRATYYGQKFSESPMKGTLIIISERILDVMFLAIIVGIVFYQPALDFLMRFANDFSLLSFGLMLAGASLLIYTLWASPKAKTILGKCGDFFRQLSFASSDRFSLVVYTLLIWIFEAIAYYFAMQSLGLDITFTKCLILMSVVTLSTSIPSTPGYFGTFHLVFIETLQVIEPTLEVSFLAAISIHMVLWLTSNSIGVLFIVIDFGMRRIRA